MDHVPKHIELTPALEQALQAAHEDFRAEIEDISAYYCITASIVVDPDFQSVQFYSPKISLTMDWVQQTCGKTGFIARSDSMPYYSAMVCPLNAQFYIESVVTELMIKNDIEFPVFYNNHGERVDGIEFIFPECAASYTFMNKHQALKDIYFNILTDGLVGKRHLKSASQQGVLNEVIEMAHLVGWPLLG